MTAESFLNGKVGLCCGDSWHFLKDQPDNRYDSVVTDPPYALASTTKRWANTPRTESTMPKVPVYARATQGFMGQKWDTGTTAFASEFWTEVLRVVKPGGHVVAFGGTRTYHRLACAIEDAGFEIRDQLGWCFGSGFPKSHNAGNGWGTALKPAWEPICLARRPLIGTVAENMLHHGTGAINIRACRVPSGASHDNQRDSNICTCSEPKGDQKSRNEDIRNRALSEPEPAPQNVLPSNDGPYANGHRPHEDSLVDCLPCGRSDDELVLDVAENDQASSPQQRDGHRSLDRCATCGGIRDYLSMPCDTIPNIDDKGRWPANIIHDGSDEVIAAFPDAPGQQQDVALDAPSARTGTIYGKMNRHGEKSADQRYQDRGSTNFAALPGMKRGDTGSAARFFYAAKADSDDRLGSKHPTVKPVDLMQWLVRLVTPKGGLVLDPFAGTGTTAEACYREGMRCFLIERETEYQDCIRRRMRLVMAGPEERTRESIKAKLCGQPMDSGPLFENLVP